MRLNDIRDMIVAYFFSRDLRSFIEENDYAFTGDELLSLTDHFAPSYQEKIRIASMLSETDDAVAQKAKMYASKMNSQLEAFLKAGKNEVYELTIQDTPDAYPERYLAADFETALKTIDRFYETYADQPGKEGKYTVEKRRILTSEDEFQEDVIFFCELTSQKTIRTLSGNLGGECGLEALPLPEFPAFLPSVSPVKYISMDGRAEYGVYVDLDHPPTDACFVIPFGSQMMKTQSFKALWPTCNHQHIPCPDVESIALSALPAHMQEAYFAFVAWWEEFNGQN